MTEEDFRQIRYIARSCAKATTFLTEEELFQQGCLEFMLNKDRYNSDKGKLWDYMWTVVMGKLKSYIRQNEKGVKMPENKFKSVDIEFIPIKNPEIWNALCRQVEEKTENEYDEIEKVLTFAPTIDRALMNLTERERLVIKLRYGLNGERPHKLEEVGNILEVTRERVRQIEARALRKLQLFVRKEGMTSFED